MKHPTQATALAAALAGTLAALAAGGWSSTALAQEPSAAATAPAQPALVERGRYLVSVLACHDCHTPLVPGPDGRPAPDMSRMLSGHPASLEMPPAPALPEGPWQVVASATLTAWNGPWGTSFAANLTPDPQTGLGDWSWENFRDTIRTGRHMGRGRPVLPPMPIPVYRNLEDDDLRAVYAYLQSIPPISNRAPEPLPPPEAPH